MIDMEKNEAEEEEGEGEEGEEEEKEEKKGNHWAFILVGTLIRNENESLQVQGEDVYFPYGLLISWLT